MVFSVFVRSHILFSIRSKAELSCRAETLRIPLRSRLKPQRSCADAGLSFLVERHEAPEFSTKSAADLDFDICIDIIKAHTTLFYAVLALRGLHILSTNECANSQVTTSSTRPFRFTTIISCLCRIQNFKMLSDAMPAAVQSGLSQASVRPSKTALLHNPQSCHLRLKLYSIFARHVLELLTPCRVRCAMVFVTNCRAYCSCNS